MTFVANNSSNAASKLSSRNRLEPGVVVEDADEAHERVEGAERVMCVAYGPLVVRGRGRVALDRQHSRPELRELLALGRVDLEHAHACTLGEEGLHRRSPDPGASAHEERGLAVEPAHELVQHGRQRKTARFWVRSTDSSARISRLASRRPASVRRSVSVRSADTRSASRMSPRLRKRRTYDFDDDLVGRGPVERPDVGHEVAGARRRVLGPGVAGLEALDALAQGVQILVEVGHVLEQAVARAVSGAVTRTGIR